jgi:hypothetical protein
MLFLLFILEIIMLVLASLFLRPFTEIIVETGNYLNQLGPSLRKFLNSYNIFNALG